MKNQRDDFLHKLSRSYINNYDFIAVEKLNINGLIRISCNARNIMDSSWNRFTQFLSYKAESAGKTVVKVNPRGTSQECYKCGKEVKKSLVVRTHRCPYCGLEIDRDFNYAFSLEKRFRRSVRAGTVRIYAWGDRTSTERNFGMFSR